MRTATGAVRKKEKGSYKRPDFFGVQQTTLEHYIKDWQKIWSEAVKTTLERNQVLTSEAENYLAEFFGLTIKDVRLAYQLAARNWIKNQF